MSKIGHMRKEVGEEAYEVMQQLKRALDPQNIMNPGKVAPV